MECSHLFPEDAAPRSAGQHRAELAAPSPVVAFPPPRGLGVGHWAGAVRDITLKLRNHCTSRDWGCKGASKLKCVQGSEVGGGLLLCCVAESVVKECSGNCIKL